MLKTLFDYAPRALALLPPEEAHEVTLKSLELGVFPSASAPDDPSLRVAFAGLSLPNPVGIAAGFDKDARVPDAVLQLGCGFAEIGTVTPLPQSGNPSPRVFRLPRDRAVINRLGFNNGGHQAALARLQRRTATRRRRRQHRRQQGDSGPYRRLRARTRDILRRRQLLHDQHLLAEHAGPARPAGSRRARRAAVTLARCARQADRCRKSEAPDRRQAGARYRRERVRCHRHAACEHSGSTPSPSRTRRCRAAG